MVYCSKCGTKNAEDAETCTKCGAKLEVSMEKKIEKRIEKHAEEWGKQMEKRAEEECFGLPHGGAIAGIIIGIIIIIVALSWIPGLFPPELREAADPLFWPIILIIFGILILVGAMYKFSRK